MPVEAALPLAVAVSLPVALRDSVTVRRGTSVMVVTGSPRASAGPFEPESQRSSAAAAAAADSASEPGAGAGVQRCRTARLGVRLGGWQSRTRRDAGPPGTRTRNTMALAP